MAEEAGYFPGEAGALEKSVPPGPPLPVKLLLRCGWQVPVFGLRGAISFRHRERGERVRLPCLKEGTLPGVTARRLPEHGIVRNGVGRTVQHADGKLIREATEARIPGERTGSGQVRITGGYSSLFPGRDVFDGKKDVFSRR